MNAEKKTVGSGFVNWCNRWIPNAMVLAFILTVVVAVLCIIFTDSPLITSTETQTSLIDAWTGGFWTLLTFAMQMTLVMLTGYVLASAPIVKKGLMRIAQIPNTTLSAFLLCGVVTTVLFWIHWGLGMMASIVLGQQILAASRMKGYKMHMPSLVAYIYACEMCCNGISQAGPLNATSPGFLQSMVSEEAAAVIPNVISLAETVLNAQTIIQCILLFLVITLVCYVTMPKKEHEIEEITPAFAEEILNSQIAQTKSTEKQSPAEWLNNSPLMNMIIGFAGMIFVVKTLAASGIVGISLNNYNFMMLMLGLILCKTPNIFCKCVVDAITSCWGVIIQFPFYAGIYGLITLTDLNAVIVHAFTSIATQETFPVIAYLYTCVLNIVVPSGGSKFVIEAPYLLEVCAQLDVSAANIINAYTFGDLTTNLIQPFWALAIVAMFRVDFKKIIPYTFLVMIGLLIVNLLFIWFLY